MRWGRWGRWPIRWGGGKTTAQRIYESMLTGRGTSFSIDDGALASKELRCVARAVARAQRAQARGAVQGHVISATDLLPEWERGLGRTPGATETEAQRRFALDAVLASNLFPSYDNIVAALTKVLDGEVPTLITARAPVKTFQASVAITLPTLTVVAGGVLNGMLNVGFAGEKADGSIYWANNAGSLSADLGSTGKSLLVSAVPLSTWPAGVEKVHYYLSVLPNDSKHLAYVATGTGGAVLLSTPPHNFGVKGLHHVGVVVSALTWADKQKRANIDLVLGPMLPSWCGYDVIASSPFILSDAAILGSPLDSGGL